MKRYISFYDCKANKSCFIDISHTADVSVKVSKKDIIIEISNEHCHGLTHSHKWDDAEVEKVNQLFKDKQDDKFTKYILLFVTKRVREFVAQNSLKNAILEIEEENKAWHEYMRYALDHMEDSKDKSKETKTNE